MIEDSLTMIVCILKQQVLLKGLRIIGKNFLAKEFYGTMTDIQEKDKETQRFFIPPHKSFLGQCRNIREIDRKIRSSFHENHRCPITRP